VKAKRTHLFGISKEPAENHEKEVAFVDEMFDFVVILLSKASW
jgi:hypothetical protein